jgi:hypothetical protein
MKGVLERICNLQQSYSSTNTPEMQERGHLIRSELADEVRSRLPYLQGAFSSIFDDLAVEGSDGIGRKTEAPWVRLFSKAMSPNPREGFYLVIHFAANGSAVFITVGCGSTVWRGGDLTPVSDEELEKRTSWARSVVHQKWGGLDPFTDQIALGAKAPLPRTFEKATALAKRILVSELADANLDRLLFQAAERLGEIYLAQIDQRDVSPGDQATEEIVAIARPLRRRPGKQGLGLTAAERKAVERRAMTVAVEHLELEGYRCRDTSTTESFDILAKKGSDELKVEVKGTTSDLCDSVLMTRNEVELHQAEKGATGLLIVSGIRLARDGDKPTASGGELEALIPWNIDEWRSEPIAFQVSRAKQRSG